MRDVETYIDNIQYTAGCKNIITVEHRSNNPKRDYLFCNKVQGKHIPAKPSDVFNMIHNLVTKVIGHSLDDKKVVVVGFAETATAIGHILYDKLPTSVYYLQTTREDCSPMKKLIEFQEEHSHATEQFLFGDISEIPDFDYVLFVDDEISTGKTILNFIREFSKLKNGVGFGVASICNWQNEEDAKKFKSNNIDVFALITGQIRDTNIKMNITNKVVESTSNYANENGVVTDDQIKAVNYVSTSYGYFPETLFNRERCGVNDVIHHDYAGIANKLEREAAEFCEIHDLAGKKILVLGVEECMYIPLRFALALEQHGANVRFHAPSRSSIDIIKSVDGSGNAKDEVYNKLVNKHKLHSLYDVNRVTYVYNLDKYDKIIIMSDKNTENTEFIKDIAASLLNFGNKIEDIVTWYYVEK